MKPAFIIFLSSISSAIYVCAQVESTEGDIEKNDKILESHGGLGTTEGSEINLKLTISFLLPAAFMSLLL